jgi:nucleotide-binding universal stress UspA family protein
MFKRVLLCYDGSKAGRRALRRGAELAVLLNAQVYVLCIIPEGIADPVVLAGASGHACLVDNDHGFRKMLDESVRWLTERGVAAEGFLATGNTTEQILTYCERLAIDLIVLGYYPRPSGGFWWSSAQRGTLAERAKCCIFVAVDAANEPPVTKPAR